MRGFSLFPRGLVHDDGVFGAFVRLVPVIRLAFDLVPFVFLLYPLAVLENQCAAGEIAQPEYPGQAVVPVSMPLAFNIAVRVILVSSPHHSGAQLCIRSLRRCSFFLGVLLSHSATFMFP